MDRREALRRTALAIGGVLSAPTILGILNGCTAKPSIDWKPKFFSEDQGILVSQVAGIIIPKTDTPGAREAGVPGFIDSMVKDVYNESERDQFMKSMQDFISAAGKENSDPFIEWDEKDQTAFVKKLHDEALKAEAKEKPFVLAMKELTVAGFFTSEPGATKVLQYEAVPGSYKGCIPIKEAGAGKTWAT